MVNKLLLISTIVFAVVIGASSVQAGGSAGKFGIGLSVSESSPLISGIVWVGDKITVEPNFAIFRAKRGNTATYNYFLGAGLVYHFRSSSAEVRPILGARLDIDHLTGGGLSLTDTHYTGLLGAEYFISDNFAFRGEYQITYLKTDEMGSATLSLPRNTSFLSTSQQLSVIVYF